MPSSRRPSLIGPLDDITNMNTPCSCKKRKRGSSAAESESHKVARLHTVQSSFLPLQKAPLWTRPTANLFHWGEGSIGQFGVVAEEVGRPTKNIWSRAQIRRGLFGGPGAGLVAIAAGGLHSLFLDENGTVWSCGNNDGAALGRRTEDVPDLKNDGGVLDADELSLTPHPIDSLLEDKFRAVKIAAGDNISAALSDSGQLRVWGSLRNTEGAVPFSGGVDMYHRPTSILEEHVADVVSGEKHLVILTTRGDVYTWGVGDFGQLGITSPTHDQVMPPQKVSLHKRAVIVGAGGSTSFAVDEDGVAWGWGLNAHGQTCTGHIDEATDDIIMLPEKVDGLGQNKVVQIVGGEYHSLLLLDDGRVLACGRTIGGELGQLKDRDEFECLLSPHFVSSLTEITFPDPEEKVIRIEAGSRRSMAITEGGALYCWGEGSQSELGLGIHVDQVDQPTSLVSCRGTRRTVAVSCGGQHTLALFRDLPATP